MMPRGRRNRHRAEADEEKRSSDTLGAFMVGYEVDGDISEFVDRLDMEAANSDTGVYRSCHHAVLSLVRSIRCRYPGGWQGTRLLHVYKIGKGLYVAIVYVDRVSSMQLVKQ